MPTSFDTQDTNSYESDLARARGYKPVTKKELRKAYSQYEDVGLKLGQVKKNQTDEQLYNKAKKTVLDWWKLQQKKKDNLGSGPNGSGGSGPNGGNGGVGGPGAGASGGGGTGSSGGWSGGAGGGLPNTAVGSGGGNPNLPDIISRSEKEQQSSATNPDVQRREQWQTKPLTSDQVRSTLQSIGAPTNWNPPAYARSSKAELIAWAKRAAQQASLTLAPHQVPVLTTAAMQQLASRAGLAINVTSVPAKYRLNTTAFNSYLASVKYAQQAAATAARQKQLIEQMERTKNV